MSTPKEHADEKRRTPKFGEPMRGIYASERNPTRDGLFVRVVRRKGRMNPGTFYELTDGKGKFWLYPRDSVAFLRCESDVRTLYPEPKP